MRPSLSFQFLCFCCLWTLLFPPFPGCQAYLSGPRIPSPSLSTDKALETITRPAIVTGRRYLFSHQCGRNHLSPLSLCQWSSYGMIFCGCLLPPFSIPSSNVSLPPAIFNMPFSLNQCFFSCVVFFSVPFLTKSGTLFFNVRHPVSTLSGPVDARLLVSRLRPQWSLLFTAPNAPTVFF